MSESVQKQGFGVASPHVAFINFMLSVEAKKSV